MEKIKNVCLILVLAFVLFVPSAMAADIYSCNAALGDVLIDEKIPNTVSTIITVIKIVVPILLVIFGMMDLFKGIVAQKEDEIKKGQQMFIKRLIAGALVFFVITIVQMLISFVAEKGSSRDNMMSCVNCFIKGDCTYRKSGGVCPKGTSLSENGKYCVK